MSYTVITCPHAPCGKSLRLPLNAIGQPLSCPHCRSAIGVTLDADGEPTTPVVLHAGARLPRMLLVPAVALLVLGTAGVFANGYIAADAYTRPGADIEQARRQVGDLNNLDEMSGPKETKKANPNEEPTTIDLIAVVGGQAAAAGVVEMRNETIAKAWAPWVVPVNSIFGGVSLLVALGGFLILRGRGYWIALLACIAAMLNFNHACCFPGAIVGLWGILTLVRDDARKHFGR